MRIPDYLTNDHAKKFWKAHISRVATEDVETFALACQIWGLIRECDSQKNSKEAVRFVGLVKQYMALCKLVFPPSTKKAKSDEATAPLLFPITKPKETNAG